MTQSLNPKTLGWIAAAAVSCAFAGAAQAEIYRWVDAAGVVNYSNGTPPANVRATVVARDETPVNTISVPQVSNAEAQALTENLAATQRASAISQGMSPTAYGSVGSSVTTSGPQPEYYPPQVMYSPTVRRINASPRYAANPVRPIPYGIGTLQTDQTVRYREAYRHR